MSICKPFFVSLTVTCIATAWWGCASSETLPAEEGSTTQSAASSGVGGAGGAGGIGVDTDGGDGGGGDDSGACVSTSAAAERVQLDILFLIDRSASMSGAKWNGIKSALSEFWNDPSSFKISAGLSYFPNWKAAACDPADYQKLDVPFDVLPTNAFALTNSMPADATGGTTPTWGAIKGSLTIATAYQDLHPKHKVILVLATDGDPNGCGTATVEDIAAFAASARSYNGVLTYVIGVAGSTIPNLDKIAKAGGTEKAYDVTMDISEFASKMEEIRGSALGCEFEIPAPPNNGELDPDKVNVSYTPKGMGMPKLLLRASDLAECKDQPGWYYDNNFTPTKFILCPASCATVQSDTNAKISALFGCKSQIF